MPTQNILPTHQQMFLSNFLAYLKKLEYDAAITDTELGDDKCYSTLYVVLDISSDQMPGESMLRLETAFLPTAEDDNGSHAILQMIVPILIVSEGVNIAELHKLLIKLNTFLPMGSFGYWEDQHMVYHKQNNMVANNNYEVLFSSFEEQINTIRYVLTSFVPSIASVALDGDTAQKALDKNPFAQIYS